MIIIFQILYNKKWNNNYININFNINNSGSNFNNNIIKFRD